MKKLITIVIFLTLQFLLPGNAQEESKNQKTPDLNLLVGKVVKIKYLDAFMNWSLGIGIVDKVDDTCIYLKLCKTGWVKKLVKNLNKEYQENYNDHEKLKDETYKLQENGEFEKAQELRVKQTPKPDTKTSFKYNYLPWTIEIKIKDKIEKIYLVENGKEDRLFYESTPLAFDPARMAEEKRQSDLRKSLYKAMTEINAKFEISGTAESVDITYRIGNSTSQEKNVKLPWEYELHANRGDFLYLSAQNNGKTGTVYVRISKNGMYLESSQSEGAYAIATASGTY